MRLYRGQVQKVAEDIIQTLRADDEIEVEDVNVGEAEKDLIAIMEQYLKRDYEIREEAKDIIDRRGLTHYDLGRARRELCERYNHPVGDEGIRFMASQMVESFMISRFVEEVFGEDVALRKKILTVFKKHLVDFGVLDEQVRDRIKNLQEGTSAWNIQYQKVMREVRRKHGLS